MLEMFRPPDVSLRTCFERKSVFNLLMSTHCLLAPLVQYIIANVRTERKSMAFSNLRKHIARCQFKTSHVISVCGPSNKESKTLAMKNETTNEQSSMYAEDDVSQENRIV